MPKQVIAIWSREEAEEIAGILNRLFGHQGAGFACEYHTQKDSEYHVTMHIAGRFSVSIELPDDMVIEMLHKALDSIKFEFAELTGYMGEAKLLRNPIVASIDAIRANCDIVDKILNRNDEEEENDGK